jgi:hypothetical protein
MKLDINIRLLFSVLFLILLTSTFYPINSNALDPGTTLDSDNPEHRNVECSGNATRPLALPGTTNCELTPDEQKLTFLRLDLCTAKPTGPTVSATVDRSNCSTFFKNDSGAEVSVQKGVGTSIGTSSDYSAVPHGTYTYGIVTMSNVFKYTSSVTFAGTMKGFNESSGSTTCVTRPGSVSPVYGFSNGLSTAEGNVTCAEGAVASEISIGINTLTMNGNNCRHLVNFTGTNGIVSAYALEADDTLVTGVGNTKIGNARDEIANGTTGCIHSTDNGISKILGIMEFGSPLVIGPRTAGIQISYNNTRGLRLNDGNGSDSNVIYLWDVAFFDFTMTAKVRRSRGAWN